MTRPVRVAFAVDALGRAGTESQLLALIHTLDRRRVEPSLVLLDGTSAASRELEPADCPVVRLGVTKLLGATAARAAVRLARIWRDRRPDVLQAYFLDASYFTIPVAKLCGVRRVVRVRNNLGYWLTPKARVLNRVVAPFIDVQLTNSAAGRDALIRQDRLSPRRVAVVENGVDLDRFPAGMPPDVSKPVVRIACVANLRAVKNIDGLMRAARGVIDQFPRAVFEVAGGGEARAALEKLHAELGLGARFVLCGPVQDIPAFLAGAEVAVLPSHSEGMSNAVLEYMAAGRAVVATDVGANRQVLAGTGVVCGPGELAAAILGVLTNPAAAAGMGAAARDRAEATFGRAAWAARFAEFFEGFVSGAA